MTKQIIKTQEFKNSTFAFLRTQRPNESNFRETIKKGVVYVHNWGTGYEELIFETHELAAKWWKAEVKRLSAKPIYLAVDIDREIFKDESGKEYNLSEVTELLNKTSNEYPSLVNMTLMAQRLIQQFKGNFAEAREFYEAS